MKYKLISRSESEDLSEEINGYLEQGWELYGNPSIFAYEYKKYWDGTAHIIKIYTQAIIFNEGVNNGES